MNPGWSVWAGVAVTPLMIAAGQILFKLAGTRLEERGLSFVRVLIDPYLVTGVAIYGVATIVWVYVLRYLTLSQAYPFMAMSMVLVPLASAMFFAEVLTLRYWLGAALIIFGMLVINT